MLLEGLRKLLYPNVMPKPPDCHKRKEYFASKPFPSPPQKNKSWHFCGQKMPKKTTVVLNGSLVFLAGAMKAMKVSMIVGPSSTRCLCSMPFPFLHLKVLPQGSGTGKVHFALQLFQEVLAWANDDWEAMKHPSPVSERSTALANGKSFLRHLEVKKDRIQAIATICCYKSHDHFERNTGIL